MKKHFYAFLALALPLQVLAQPTINNAYDLHIGDEIHARIISNMPAGASGHQTWDFSSAVDTNGDFTTYIQDDSSGGMIIVSSTENFKNVGSTTYLKQGIGVGYDPGAIFVKRPLTYGLTDNNSWGL